MRNTIQDSTTIIDEVAPSGGVVSGVGYVIGNRFGVAVATVAENQRAQFRTCGIVSLPKGTGGSSAFTAGQRVWWDNTNKICVNASATGRFLIGTAAGLGLDFGSGAADANATVTVQLDGTAVVAV